ncbi:spore germination protein [Eubacterium multiforme]|uniref:GerA spore germination protein n=1 Tax=Eubacterium multiforme TaxID=83339 RepID=A0ABT9UUU9_9FIRM|nr:spore germination protein [Eubacterium multiforme]MDQ0150092.1 hypothetical protein [Eubacterium multiforme]
MNDKFVNELMKSATSTESTIIIKELLIDKNKSTPIVIMYSESIVNKDIINRDILNPLMYNFNVLFPDNIDKYDFLVKVALPVSNCLVEDSFSNIVNALRSGKTILTFYGLRKAIIIDTISLQYRSISTPTITSTIASSKEDLNESLETNISIFKRRIKDKNLIIKNMNLGRRSKTNINVLYLKDIANQNVVNNVLKDIASLDVDNIQSLGALQQYIEEFNYSIAPQGYITDSAENAVDKLSEGKVIVLMEGSPYALCLPALLIEFFHSLDDYNQRTIVASFSRALRFIAIIIVLTLPSLYVILTKFNPELLIDKYVQPIASSRQGIPLSPFLEIFTMDLVVEFLREGGLRLPSKVGQTLSIVSGIIIGDAAIQSKIISPSALFIVGISVVCTFLIPNYQMALSIRLIKFPFLILSNTFGILGFVIGFFFLLLYLFNLNVYGIDYVSFYSDDMKDTFIRGKLSSLIKRPIISKTKDKIRLGTNHIKKWSEKYNEKKSSNINK